MTGRYVDKEPALYANETPVENPAEQLAGIMMEIKNMQMELLDQLNGLIYSVCGSPCEKHESKETNCLMQDAVQMLKNMREALLAVEALREVMGC